MITIALFRNRLLIGTLALAATFPARASVPSSTAPPLPQREFRGAWVATVANIDWPSKPGLPAGQQQAEFIAIVKRAKALRLNAVILQVRPACDALYPSNLEPWSEYLTGKMGKPPAPYYDPLAFAIQECRKRGLELHAWFNPFRARDPSGTSLVARNHISRTQPKLVKSYGRYAWLDPGERDSQRHSMNVIMDVVRRYDIDGVHLDDYFYPYQEKGDDGNVIDFPDGSSWKEYLGAGGNLSRADRRRESINYFVRSLYANVKKEKPWVRVGISPFGIWRPGNPAKIRGTDAYTQIYADSRKWLNQGWLDYCAPQLYWPIAPEAQSYPALLNWWASQNVAKRHVWPGIASHKAGTKFSAKEIPEQIRLARNHPGITGHIHWNMSGLMKNKILIESMHRRVYTGPALTPASTWLDNRPPAAPALKTKPGEALVSWTEPPGTERASQWVLQSYSGGAWQTQILPANVKGTRIEAGKSGHAIERIAVSAVDRCGNLSPPSIIRPR
jgi:uncharacterized lipoprotein YddW (UPF0748 family)